MGSQVDVCDLSTTSSCKSSWESARTKQMVNIKIAVHEDPSYPDYYQIATSTDGLQALAGYYMIDTDCKDFPSYRKTDGNYHLYLENSGYWVISAIKGGKDVIAQSRPKAELMPPNNKYWKIRNGPSSHSWLGDSSLSVEPFRYPEVFCLSYSGNEKDIESFLTENSLLGSYKRQNSLHNNLPYYMKENPSRYLLQNDQGQWVISEFMSELYGMMYQDRKQEPAPLKGANWRLKLNNVFVETNTINITRCELSNRSVILIPDKSRIGENEPMNEPDLVEDYDEYGKYKTRAIFISLDMIPIVLTFIGLVIRKELKKRRERNQPAEVDENYYYGSDYEVGETVFVDNNDYYGK